MSLYPKIESPYRRFTEGPQRNKFDVSQWSRPEFDVLSNQDWTWTEKIDGTNIRVIWDGHRVRFGGRTDDAQMPTFLMDALVDMFPEELMEQNFQDTEVILYGEGYGPKIQKGGGNYRKDPSFILFDVRVGKWWLEFASIQQVAGDLGIASVPVAMVGSVHEAIAKVSEGMKSAFGDFWAEGLVGKAPLGLLSRSGDRIVMKVKHKDLFNG